jgi:hypothetical protein
MATYVNDLRLTELATGEGSGTWGVTTNTNLELIGEALGYGTQDCFATDADATTTVADGATDPARAMYFKVTSSATLTATRTLTIGPNTVSRVMFIENATTGSQSIEISQGSGGNVTIAAGKTAVVYLDGAGAGAAVVDAMALVDPGVTDTLAEVLAAGNATGGTDIAVGTGDDITFADSSKAIFGAGSDLEIYHSGTHSIINETGTGELKIQATNLRLQSASGGENYLTADLNGAVRVYYDDAQKFQTTATGIDVTGTVTADGITNAGIITTDDYFGLGSTYNRIADRDTSGAFGGGYNFYVDGTTPKHDSTGTLAGYYYTSGGEIRLYASPSSAPDTAAIERIRILNNGDISFYEDTGTTAKFFWDASAESLGIGTASPGGYRLNVQGGTSSFTYNAANQTACEFYNTNATGYGVFIQGGGAASRYALNVTDYAGTSILYAGNGNNVGIGTTSPLGKLAVEGSGTNSEVVLSRVAEVSGLYSRIGWTAANGLDIGVDSGNVLSASHLTMSVDGLEAVRIDASGNLLVGKSVTTFNTEGFVYEAGKAVEVTTDSDRVMRLNRTTNDGSILEFNKDGTTVGSIGSVSGLVSYIDLDPRSGGTGIGGTNTDSIVPVTGTGVFANGTKDLGLSTARWRNLYLSGGVYLGGTGAANLLDDYEEGTWTPGVDDGTNTGSLTAISAIYTKIGQVVHIRAALLNLDTTGLTAGAGLRITGLPFAPPVTTNSEVYIPIATNLITTTKGICAELNNGSTALQFLEQDEAKSGAKITVSAATSGNADIFLSFTYHVG